ncbi:MAG: thiosulfate oxidation carrier protein SoxY [Methylobacillus sp.]|jgi:sulfur-oxidizing protein SoxY|nr:thiosulfate oxidation carrier protein SoxY [Methylobacillus sp.]
MKRRELLKAAFALLLFAPLRALAAWNREAFESAQVEGVLQGLGIQSEQDSAEIEIIAPQFAENGAVIQVEITSRIPNTESIILIAEKNPTPLIADFQFTPEAEPFVITRIKMAETADFKVLVKAEGRYFSATRHIEVAIGGCG